MLSFPPFRLDVDQERLWKGHDEIGIRRKPFAILKYLVTNPKRLVTHAELLQHVWAGTAVSESTVRTQLHELRQLLGEGVIETVIGRGYRFVAELASEAAPAPSKVGRIVVGRAAELAALHASLERASSGHRQVCFITGEPGIGKTTVVDAFTDELPAGVLAARGHCVEQHGAPEPYLAVIELLTRLRHSDHGSATQSALISHAPMFLSQVPHLVPPDQLDAVIRRARDGSEAKLIRELIDAIEALSAQHTLVLVLEDLQWSDVATIDLLAVLAARRDRARLLVIATSRRGEANTVTHPLNRVMRSLIARNHATPISLDRVAHADIQRLLDIRFPDHAFPAELIDVMDRITAGTPLFVVSIVDDLLGRGMLAQRDGRWVLAASLDEVRAHRPETLKQLIDIRLDRLEPAEQRVLEAASAVGAEFSCGLVAAALEMSIEDVDEICDGLVRRSLFLRRERDDQWPDGSSHPRYAVTHGLVQEVCIERGAPARRQRWHRLIAQQLEKVFGEHATEIAHALAMHHELGQSISRAIQCYVAAAERIAQRFASHDALVLFRRGLDLLPRLPAGLDRDGYELRLLGGIVASTLRTSDPSSPEPARQIERMIVLARGLGDAPRQCSALLNLMFRHQLVADHAIGIEISKQVEEVVRTADLHPALVRFAEAMCALNRMWRGELAGVADTFASIIEAGDTLEEPSLGILGPTDRRTVLTTFLALAHWLSGDVARAARETESALALARATNDPFGIGFTQCNAAWLASLTGDRDRVRELVAPVLEIAAATVWQSTAAALMAASGPPDRATADNLAADLRARLAYSPLGATRIAIPIIDLLRRSGSTVVAVELADEMLRFARDHSERIVEPELLRVRGELVEATAPAEAADWYRKSLALAESAGAKLLEQRARQRLG